MLGPIKLIFMCVYLRFLSLWSNRHRKDKRARVSLCSTLWNRSCSGPYSDHIHCGAVRVYSETAPSLRQGVCSVLGPYPPVHWSLDISRVSKAAGFQCLLWVSCSPSWQEEEGSRVHPELLEDLPWENDGNCQLPPPSSPPFSAGWLVTGSIGWCYSKSVVMSVLSPSTVLFPWALCPLVCLLLFNLLCVPKV